MKVVAVSQRVDACSERGELRDALDQRLVRLLVSLGLTPVPVPNCLVQEKRGAGHQQNRIADWLSALLPRAIVLSGGNNIGDNLDRDLTEHHLLDYARDHQLPTLGICRGMQMMAHWAGVGLDKIDGHVRTRHLVLGGIEQMVNSYHGYALARCPVGFDVLARSEDGCIEAIKHAHLPWEGWMWHPEREEPFAVSDLDRLRRLFDCSIDIAESG